MAVSLIKDRPVKREEMEVLQEAAKAIRAHEEAQKAVKAAEAHVRALCRQYDLAAGVWGFAPHHLRRACEARGLI